MRSLPQILVNFHWIAAGEAARAAQIHASLLGPFLTANRIASVVNLRGHHPEFGWWRREREACAACQIPHFDAMLDSRLLPTPAMLAALIDAFEAAPRPLLIKCSGGQDRTSLAAALYLLHRDGRDARNAALAQFSRFPYLHFPKARQRWLRLFLDYVEQASGGRRMADWIRHGYDPKSLRTWLDNQGLGQTHNGLFL
jgi:hypothetical protein